MERKWSSVGVDFVEISLGSLLAGVERLLSRSARNTPADWYLPRKGEPPWCRATFDKTDLHAPCQVAYLHKYFPSYFLLSCECIHAAMVPVRLDVLWKKLTGRRPPFVNFLRRTITEEFLGGNCEIDRYNWQQLFLYLRQKQETIYIYMD